MDIRNMFKKQDRIVCIHDFNYVKLHQINSKEVY